MNDVTFSYKIELPEIIKQSNELLAAEFDTEMSTTKLSY